MKIKKIFLLMLLLIIFIPAISQARRWVSSNYRCSSNIRDIENAVDSYNCDHPKSPIKEIPPGKSVFIINELIKGNYLKSNTTCHVTETRCYYTNPGSSEVLCEFHSRTNNDIKTANTAHSSRYYDFGGILANSIAYSVCLTFFVFVFLKIVESIIKQKEENINV